MFSVIKNYTNEFMGINYNPPSYYDGFYFINKTPPTYVEKDGYSIDIFYDPSKEEFYAKYVESIDDSLSGN